MCFRQNITRVTVTMVSIPVQHGAHMVFWEKIKTRARTSFQKTFIAADFALSPAFFHSIETLLPKQYQLNPKKFKQTLFGIQVMLYSTNEITAHCVHFSVKKHIFA